MIEASLEALGKIKSINAIPIITNILRSNSSINTSYAYGALENIRDIQVSDFLLEDLYAGKSRAAVGLGLLKDKRSLYPMIDMLKEKVKIIDISNLVKVLGYLGCKEAMYSIISILELESYINHDYIIIDIFEALSNFHSHLASNAIIKCYKTRNIIYLNKNIYRTGCYKALSLIGGQEAEDFIITESYLESQKIRCETIQYLEKIGGEKSINRLLDLLNDSDTNILHTARVSLSRLIEKELLNEPLTTRVMKRLKESK